MKKLLLITLFTSACVDLSGPEYNKPKIDKSGWEVNVSVDSTLYTEFNTYFVGSKSIEEKAALYKSYSKTYFETEASCECKLPWSYAVLKSVYLDIMGSGNNDVGGDVVL